MFFYSLRQTTQTVFFLDSFCYFHKHANLYLMGPNMKLLKQENICSMLKDILKGKEK